jgi:hypothetical protein
MAWGQNNGGQTNIPAGLTNVIALAGGYAYALALRNSGAPFITANLLPQTLWAGETLNLRAFAAGSQPLSYQWIFNGVPIVGATNLSLAPVYELFQACFGVS